MLVQGSTPLRLYGLLLALALAFGFVWFRARWLRSGGHEREAALLLALGLPGVLLGARIAHCLFYDLDRTLAGPLFVLAVHRGGLASHGALGGLVLAVWIAARHERLDGARLADALAAPAALGVVLVRLGNFANSEVVGRVTTGGWGVRFPRRDGVLAPPRHPVQLYEAGLGLLVLVLLLLLERSRARAHGEPGTTAANRAEGRSAAVFLVLYFGGRILLETVKEPEGLLGASGPLTTGAWLSVLPAVAGALYWLWLRRRGSGCAPE